MLAPCQPAGPLRHLGGEGGEAGPSPQLPPNCSLPTPLRSQPQRADNLRSAGPHSTALPYCLSCWRPDGRECGTPLPPCFQGCFLLSPGPTHGLAQRRLSRRQRRPLRRPPGPRRCLYPPDASPLPLVTGTRAVFVLRAATRATDTHPLDFLLAFGSYPSAPSKQKHVPPTIL